MAQDFKNGRDSIQQFSNILSFNLELKYTGNLAAYSDAPTNFYIIPVDLKYDKYALITAADIVGVSPDEPVITTTTPGAVMPLSNVVFVNPNSSWTAINLRETFLNTATQFYIISPNAQYVSVAIYGDAKPPTPPSVITDNLGNPITDNLGNLITTN